MLLAAHVLFISVWTFETIYKLLISGLQLLYDEGVPLFYRDTVSMHDMGRYFGAPLQSGVCRAYRYATDNSNDKTYL
jgi:hypothetical protein